jgi:hypothetical protein
MQTRDRSNAHSPLLNLVTQFDELDKKENDVKTNEEKIELAKKKLFVMETSLKLMEVDHYIPREEAEITPFDWRTRWKNKFKRFCFWGLAITGAFVMLDDAIISASVIAAGATSMLILLPITVIAAIMNIFLYKAIEVKNIREEMGLESSNNIDQLAAIRTRQIEISSRMNQALSLNFEAMKKNNNDPILYSTFVKKMYRNIKSHCMDDKIIEPLSSKIKRWVIAGTGSVFTGAFAYFSFSEAMISLVTISLLASTPPGWLILALGIGTAVITGLAYLYVQQSELFDYFNPKAKQFKIMKKREQDYKKDFPDFEEKMNAKLMSDLDDKIKEIKNDLEFIDALLRNYKNDQIPETIAMTINNQMNKLDKKLKNYAQSVSVLDKEGQAFHKLRKASHQLNNELIDLRDQLKKLSQSPMKPAQIKPALRIKKYSEPPALISGLSRSFVSSRGMFALSPKQSRSDRFRSAISSEKKLNAPSLLDFLGKNFRKPFSESLAASGLDGPMGMAGFRPNNSTP